ncbi:MAG TPA: integrase core domain-containing protein, partial [Burkholderiaceae bacterium]
MGASPEKVDAQRHHAAQLTARSNAYAESLFRTAKYRPEFPAKGFADLDAARAWAAEFVRWYN